MRYRIWIALGIAGLAAGVLPAGAPVASTSGPATAYRQMTAAGYIEEIELGGPYIEAVREGKAPEDYYLFSRFGSGGTPSPRALAVPGTDQPWTQFYTIDVSEQDPTRINGGLQDQGSVRSWGGPDGSWNQYNGGDGVKNAIHPDNMELVFACSQYGSCDRSVNGGGTMSGMVNPSTRYGWLTPIEFQPGQPDVMYWSGEQVARSDDRGQTWLSISPDLGEAELGREMNPLYAGHYGTVQAIGLNKAKPEVIYAGTDNGLLWKTTDTGGSWTKLTPEVLPDRWITHITVKPNDPETVYISFSGFRQGDQKAYLFRSRNGGESFTDISANLPRAPINDIVLVGRRLYVASDLGVYTSSARRIRWLSVGGNLPNVPLNDLRWIPANKTLYVGTFGRGIFKIRPPV